MQLSVRQLRKIIKEEMRHSDGAEILDIWPDADLSIVDSVLYFDGWSSYEDAAGILIFKGIDGSIQAVEWQDSPYTSGSTRDFDPREVTDEEALDLTSDMKAAIESTGM